MSDSFPTRRLSDLTRFVPFFRFRGVGASVAVLALSACSLGSAQDNPASQYTIERVTFVMRHGIRPPTKAPAIPEGYAARSAGRRRSAACGGTNRARPEERRVGKECVRRWEPRCPPEI